MGHKVNPTGIRLGIIAPKRLMRRMPAQIGKLTAPRFPRVQHPRAQTLRLTPEPRRRAAFAARARPCRTQGEKSDMIGQTHDRTRALRMSLSKSSALALMR